ncbi:hypothetical protein ACSSS7_003593 [Eimeria intestinalis]
MDSNAEPASFQSFGLEDGPPEASTQALDTQALDTGVQMVRTTEADTAETVTGMEWDTTSMTVVPPVKNSIHKTKTKTFSLHTVFTRLMLVSAILLAMHLCKRKLASSRPLDVPIGIPEKWEEADPEFHPVRSIEDSLDQHLRTLRTVWADASPIVRKAFVKHFYSPIAASDAPNDPLAVFEYHTKETQGSKPRGRALTYSAKATYRMQLRLCDLMLRSALVRLKSLGVLERAAMEAGVSCALLEIEEPVQEPLTSQQTKDVIGFTDLLPMLQYQSADLTGLKPGRRSQRVPRRMATHLADTLRVFDLAFSQDNCLHVFVESSLDSLQSEWDMVAKRAAEEMEADILMLLAEQDVEMLEKLQKVVKQQKQEREEENDLRKIVKAWGNDWSVENVGKYPLGLYARESSRLIDARYNKADYADSFEPEGNEKTSKYPSPCALLVGLL